MHVMTCGDQRATLGTGLLLHRMGYRNRTQVSGSAASTFTHWAIQEAPLILIKDLCPFKMANDEL